MQQLESIIWDITKIPSLLRGSVVVNVTSEDILCIIIIIIICYCNFGIPPFGDVFPPIGYVINVISHVKSLGKTFVVSRGNSPQGDNVKCIFGLPQGQVDPVYQRTRPC